MASEAGPELLINLLCVLRQPVAQALAFEKRSRGGRPEDIPRNAVVYQLAEIWMAETGRRPPSGKRGHFQSASATVLEELGLSTDGLHDCIAALLDSSRRPRRKTPLKKLRVLQLTDPSCGFRPRGVR